MPQRVSTFRVTPSLVLAAGPPSFSSWMLSSLLIIDVNRALFRFLLQQALLPLNVQFSGVFRRRRQRLSIEEEK